MATYKESNHNNKNRIMGPQTMYINPIKHFTDKVIIQRKTRVATIELFDNAG